MFSRWIGALLIGLVLLLAVPLHAAWHNTANGKMLGKRMPPLALATCTGAGGSVVGHAVSPAGSAVANPVANAVAGADECAAGSAVAKPVANPVAIPVANPVASLPGDGVTLVDFWAPGCVPCDERVPLLNRLQQQYGAHGLTVIGMARAPPAELAAHTRSLPVDYPVQSDPGGALFRQMGFYSLPYAVLVDRNGIVVWQGDPSGLSRTTIETTLAAPRLGALMGL